MKILAEQRAADAKYSCGYWFATHAGGIYAPLSLLMSVPSSAPPGHCAEAEAPQN